MYQDLVYDHTDSYGDTNKTYLFEDQKVGQDYFDISYTYLKGQGPRKLSQDKENFSKGQDFSFGVMIIFNFILFLSIALGQGFIYSSIKANSMMGEMSSVAQHVTISRRLITVVSIII